MLKQTLALVGLTLTFFSQAGLSAPVTTFSNFNYDNGNSSGVSNSGNWVGNFNGANSDSNTLLGSTFIAGVSGALSHIQVGAYTFSLDSDVITWSLHIDNGTSADLSQKLWEQTYVGGLDSSSPSVHSFFFAENSPVLQAGQSYWLVADTPTDGSQYWTWSSAVHNENLLGSKTNTYTFASNNQSDTNYFNNHQGMSMAIYVEAVPVPAAAWLFGSALIGLFAVKRNK